MNKKKIKSLYLDIHRKYVKALEDLSSYVSDVKDWEETWQELVDSAQLKADFLEELYRPKYTESLVRDTDLDEDVAQSPVKALHLVKHDLENKPKTEVKLVAGSKEIADGITIVTLNASADIDNEDWEAIERFVKILASQKNIKVEE